MKKKRKPVNIDEVGNLYMDDGSIIRNPRRKGMIKNIIFEGTLHCQSPVKMSRFIGFELLRKHEKQNELVFILIQSFFGALAVTSIFLLLKLL